MIQNSRILSFVFNFFKYIEKACMVSKSLCIVIGIFNKVAMFFKHSLINSVSSSVFDKVKKRFYESTFWRTVLKQNRLTREWPESIIYWFLSLIFSIPLIWCRSLYHRNERVILRSNLFKFIQALLRNFDIVLALCLLFIIVIPHEKWNNAYSTAIILLLVLLCFVKKVMHKNMEVGQKTLDYVLLLFILSVFLAAIFSIFPAESMKYLLFYVTCFLLVLIIFTAMKNGRNLERFLEVFLIGVTFTGLYGIYQMIVGIPFNPSFTDLKLNEGMPGRVFSSMGNPNNYAELLVMTFPFFLAIIFNSKTTMKKVIYGILALPPLITLIFTGSRSGWVAFALSIFIVMLFKNWKLIPIIIALGIIALPVIPLFAPFVYKRILTMFNSNDSSINYRFLIWNTYMPMMKDYWVNGVGLGSALFMRVLQRYNTNMLLNVIPPHTHNLFMEIWIETGFIGLLSFIWFSIRLIKNSIVSIFSKSNSYINNILICGIASIGGIFVMGFAEYIWFYNRIMLVFWAVVGLILACIAISSSQGEIENKNINFKAE